MQVGPGDFCRVAFQPTPAQHQYRIDYGGDHAADPSPPWTTDAGLLLETRRWKNCDLRQLASVRAALQASEVYGSDYVPTVFHRLNPFGTGPDPFLSIYRGTLRVEAAGRVPVLHHEPGLQLPADRRP